MVLPKTKILVKKIHFEDIGVTISDEVDKIAIDFEQLSVQLNPKILSISHNYSQNWSLFNFNGVLEYAAQNMTYPHLKEIAKKKTVFKARVL